MTEDKFLYIVKKEEKLETRKRIRRPLSVLDKYLNDQIMEGMDAGVDVNFLKKEYRLGLALCHGQNYSNEIFRKIKFINYWYMVDSRWECWPDYIADMTNSDEMAYFPDNYFDCVLSIYCTAVDENNKLQYTDMLKNVKRIIKKNGVLLMTELPYLFYWTLNPDQFDEIKKIINRSITKDEIEKYRTKSINAIKDMYNKMYEKLTDKDEISKKEYGDKLHKSLEFYKDDDNLYRTIMAGNFHGNESEELSKLIYEQSIKYTKSFLHDNGFELIGVKKRFLIARPV